MCQMRAPSLWTAPSAFEPWTSQGWKFRSLQAGVAEAPTVPRANTARDGQGSASMPACLLGILLGFKTPMHCCRRRMLGGSRCNIAHPHSEWTLPHLPQACKDRRTQWALCMHPQCLRPPDLWPLQCMLAGVQAHEAGPHCSNASLAFLRCLQLLVVHTPGLEEGPSAADPSCPVASATALGGSLSTSIGCAADACSCTAACTG